MGPDSNRLTAQDSSARDRWPCGDWSERQRAIRVHHTATSHRQAPSLTVPGTPLPTAAISDATARKDTVYTRQSLDRVAPLPPASTSAWRAAENSQSRRVAVWQAPPLDSVASRVDAGIAGAPRRRVWPSNPVPQAMYRRFHAIRCLPSAAPLCALHWVFSMTPHHLFQAGLLPPPLMPCLFQAPFACPRSHRSRLPPRLQLPSTGVGREVSLRGRRPHPPSITFLDRVVLKCHRCRGRCGRTQRAQKVHSREAENERAAGCSRPTEIGAKRPHPCDPYG